MKNAETKIKTCSYARETKDVTIDVTILPGLSEGLSQRGAWFACTANSKSIIKKYSPNCNHVVRYLINEPTSKVPLSDGEIDHLVGDVTGSLDQYRSELERQEIFFRDTRKQGKINAILYFFGILTIRWYWWIFLTRGETSFYNAQNAAASKKAANTKRVFSRFWVRGNNPEMIKVLDEINDLYEKLNGDPLEKYMNLRDYSNAHANKSHNKGDKLRAKAFKIVEQGYREVIKKYTGRSLAVDLLPTNFWQRLSRFFLHTFNYPEPNSVYPVRDLRKDIGENLKVNKVEKEILGNKAVEGNILELFLLASKKGDPICVPIKGEYSISGILNRLETIRNNDLPLKIVLHVGTEAERKALLGFDSEGGQQEDQQMLTLKRLQNAALDTNRQNEALISYYYQEMLAVHSKRILAMFPFRSRLHSLFPWLFITNGIPIASALAAVWLFINPYYGGKMQREYHNYFARMLEGVELAYHNITIHVEINSALGYVNQKILAGGKKVYRDIIHDINECALPVSVMDRALLNTITGETEQLEDHKREANNFTTMPKSFFRNDKGNLPKLKNVIKGGDNHD